MSRKRRGMADDLFEALEREGLEADRELRLVEIPAIAAELLASYRDDPELGALITQIARHLGEEPRIVERALAAGCAPGRHRDHLIREEHAAIVAASEVSP